MSYRKSGNTRQTERIKCLVCYSFVILFRLLLFQLCVVRSISFVNTIKCNANWQHSWIVWSKFKRSHTRLCLIGWAGSCLQIAVVCFLVKMYNNRNSKAAVKAEEKERERERKNATTWSEAYTHSLMIRKTRFLPFTCRLFFVLFPSSWLLLPLKPQSLEML